MTDTVIGLVIEGGTLTATVIGLVIAGVWKISSVRDDLRREAGDDMAALSRQVIESLTAMREKIVQVEFYIRDEYVSKETFNTVTERILAEMRVVTEKFDNRCTALESKIMAYLYEAQKNHERP